MKQRTCAECNQEFSKKQIKRIGKSWICVFCHRERRDNNRDHLLHTFGGVRRKVDIMKEVKERRKTFLPAIKTKRELGIPRGMSLTTVERQVLFRKYLSRGLDEEEADKKVKKCVKFLSDFVQKLKEEKKSKEDINKRFDEEFAKLCAS